MDTIEEETPEELAVRAQLVSEIEQLAERSGMALGFTWRYLQARQYAKARQTLDGARTAYESGALS